MNGYIENRLLAIVKYSVGESDKEDGCNFLNVFINGKCASVPVDTETFTDVTVEKLFKAIKDAFSGDVVDMFFDFEVV